MTETVEFGGAGRGPGLSFVLVVQKDDALLRFPIEGTLLVGKHPSNDVVLESSSVSRYHLEIRAEADRVLVKDVGSKNGTFFDRARITEVRVGAGAVLHIGGPVGPELSIELATQPTMVPSEATAFGPLIGRSRAMRSVFALLERTASTKATVLIVGETGTGKEWVAKAIHAASDRKDRPLIVIDCSAIPHNLIESELFGHVRGAFTDAHGDRAGAFEAANGGTLFLDELGELPIDLQPKLLRAVESKEIQRVGESTRRRVDVRLLAATNRNLEEEISQGRFRQDLFFRFAVVTLRLPPLRERGDDVLILAEHILRDLGAEGAFDIEGPVKEALLSYAWPGNVRELRNALERAVHLGAEHAIPMVPKEQRPSPKGPELEGPDVPFKEAKDRLVMTFERAYLERLMSRSKNISKAAREAGIDRNYLYRLLKKHHLDG